jgi:hypothetical protein
MTVLVRVKLLRQFPVELGERCGLHLLHARYQHLYRGVQELVHYVNLITVSHRLARNVRVALWMRMHVLPRKAHSSLVDLLFNRRELLSFRLVRILCVSMWHKLLIAIVKTVTCLSLRSIIEFLLHLFVSLAEHFLLHSLDVLVLLFLFKAQLFLQRLFLLTLAVSATQTILDALVVGDFGQVLALRALEGKILVELANKFEPSILSNCLAACVESLAFGTPTAELVYRLLTILI